MKKGKVLIIILILMMLGGGYYFYLDKKQKGNEKAAKAAEVERLVQRNISESYPGTPREVVKLYNQIVLCFYNEEYTNEQLIHLSTQTRQLFDNELLEHNPYEEYFQRLCDEISSYKQNERTITSCTLAKDSETRYYSKEKKRYASIQCIYYSKDSSGTAKTTEEFVLRKDDNGRWKILYWKLVENEDEK